MINFIVCSCIIDGSCTKSADYISNCNILSDDDEDC